MAVAVMLASACTGSDTPGPAPSEEPGRALATVADFDREPCAIASNTEMIAGVADAFNLVAANLLEPEGPPAALATGGPGCEYRLLAQDTTDTDAYHLLILRVVRLTSGGAEALADCQVLAAAEPLRYRALTVPAGACVGEGGVTTVPVGSAYYSFTATPEPGRADPTDEDIQLGRLTEAAAVAVAGRLPGS